MLPDGPGRTEQNPGKKTGEENGPKKTACSNRQDQDISITPLGLYRREKLYYVGLTTNLHGRIRWHLKDRHKGKWDKFIIFRIQKVAYLKDIETLIHHIVDLPGNKVKGKVPKDADLNRILREVLHDHEKAIKGIKTALK
jgi:hypothetical protein